MQPLAQEGSELRIVRSCGSTTDEILLGPCSGSCALPLGIRCSQPAKQAAARCGAEIGPRGAALCCSALAGEETLLLSTCSLWTSAVLISHVLDVSLAGCCRVPGLATFCARAAHAEVFQAL